MTGALVIGGDYRGLGVIRSLGRRGLPVWVLRDEHGLGPVSRYARRSLRWPEDESRQLALLDDLADELAGWALVPTGDETAALLARHHTELSRRWTMTTPPWEVLRWAYDKRLTHQLADRLGVPSPRTMVPANRHALAAAPLEFPVILKPSVKSSASAFTGAIALRADDRAALLSGYDRVTALVPSDTVLVQEIIPGAGVEQLSFAALCRDGQPLQWIAARRLRQFPVDFGRASTFVVTSDEPEVEELARRLLGEIGITGLVEVEFKRDPRDGRPKLLDINARVWGWHTVGARAGVDFPWALHRMLRGEQVPAAAGAPGVRWVRTLVDLPAAWGEHRAGRLSLAAYMRSVVGSVEHATFARDDPLPGLAQLPLLGWLWVRRRCAGLKARLREDPDERATLSAVGGSGTTSA